MDTKQAEEIYEQWTKTLSPIQLQNWNQLVDERNKVAKKVDGLVGRLKKHLKQKRLEPVIHAKISLSNQFDVLKAYIQKEVEFLPESVRKAHCKLVGDWSTPSLRNLGKQ